MLSLQGFRARPLWVVGGAWKAMLSFAVGCKQAVGCGSVARAGCPGCRRDYTTSMIAELTTNLRLYAFPKPRL